MSVTKRFIQTAAVLVATSLWTGTEARAALVYQNTFDSLANSTTSAPIVTSGGGTLGISNGTGGGVTFSTTGGIQGGSLDATTGQTYGTASPAGVSATSLGNGTALTALPNSGAMSSFTISFWMKGTAAGVNTSNFPRLFVLGASGSTDLASNTFGVEMRNGKLDVLANNIGSSANNAIGNTLSANTWNFIAITYDGTSSTGFNSTVQAAATGDAHNAQLYEGTDTGSVQRFGVADTTGDFATSSGTLQFGANAVLLLANRTNLSRGFNGWLDDFRIYDSVLTPTQVEAIRTSVVPEPTMGGLICLGGMVFLRRRRV